MPAERSASCSAANASLALTGTAPTQTTWLVVEVPKPWAPKAEETAAFPAGLRDLHDWLKRRVNYGLLCRPPVGEPRVIVYRYESQRAMEASVPLSAAEGWLEGALLGPPLGGPAEPALYVCTHGSRDICCGTLGVPVLQAARALGRRAVYDCSHLGGHRFAPTALLLPEWRVYGRIPVERVGELLDGRLPSAYLRGSAYLEPLLQVVQPAVETALQERVGVLELVSSEGDVHRVRAETEFGDEHFFRATVAVEQVPSVQSCRDGDKLKASPVYRLVELS